MKTRIPIRAGLTGFVIVCLRAEGDQGSDKETLAEHAKRNGLTGIARTLDKLGKPKTARLITTIPIAKLLEMEARVAQTEFAPLRSLAQYWRIDLRDRDRDEVELALVRLRGTRDVETVEEEELVLPATAAAAPDDDTHSPLQGYLGPAPEGIDAKFMWEVVEVAGAGVSVMDIEGGWQETHQDLAPISPTLIHGVNATFGNWKIHGTAVLGVIAAADNDFGVIGIAPAIAKLRMSSIFYGNSPSDHDTAGAIAVAIAAMSIGDILLIEVQTPSFLPLETVTYVRELFRLATALGILVVEPAGNGDNDLDAWVGSGWGSLNRAAPDFIDTGALMVGAGVSTVPHDRASFSNYGSRLDCYAWGLDVVTTGGDGSLTNPGPDQSYTQTFAGTSSAGPIIVGAAALVQSYYLAHQQMPMSSTQLRALLADPANGTAQGMGVAGAIGVMPDLAAVVKALDLLPDLYVRDTPGDTGLVPWPGNLCESPDVIVRPFAEPDPQASWGEGSGTENMWGPGDFVEDQHDNYVYVRMRNRGGSPATNVEATVYWTYPTTLALPSWWQKIGSVTVPLVPMGDVLTVSGPILWPKPFVPAAGHYCFIVVLDHPQDPAPITPINMVAMSVANYIDLIRNQNNVAWRNFNVVNDLPRSAGVTFPFVMAGADIEPEPFAIEVERRLPSDARLILEGPAALMLQFHKAGRDLRLDRKGEARLVLESRPRIALGEARLGGKIRYSCRLTIVPGKDEIGWGHGVAVRQMHRSEEVGRVAWRFAPKAPPAPQESKGKSKRP